MHASTTRSLSAANRPPRVCFHVVVARHLEALQLNTRLLPSASTKRYSTRTPVRSPTSTHRTPTTLTVRMAKR